MRWCAGLLLAVLLAGCGKGGAGSKSASSNASGKESSKEDGKVYTSSKGGGSQGSGGQSTNGSEGAPLPTPADTTNGRASVASDDGSTRAVKGLPVVNPGAPSPNKPLPAPAPKKAH